MNTDLKPYPAYRVTDDPELRVIPEHWEQARLASVGTFSKGSGGTKDDEVPQGVPCVRYGDLYTFHKFFVNATRSFIAPDKLAGYTPIQYGDILFTTSDVTPRNVGKSAVNLMSPPTYCGPDLIILRPYAPFNPRFLGYLLDSACTQTQKLRMQRGVTIMHIYADELKNLTIGIPPLEEQAAIVRYLDHADELINRYISAKERLIALLEEQRQAVIHQAVTRGFDPNVQLEASKVDWMTEVPQHWAVTKASRLFHIGSGTTPPTDSEEYYDGQYPWITTSELRENILTSSQRTVTQKALDTFASLRIYPSGSVVVAMYGATIGRVAILGTSATVNQACCVFVPRTEMQNRFLYYYIWAIRPHLNQSQGRKLQTRWPGLERRGVGGGLQAFLGAKSTYSGCEDGGTRRSKRCSRTELVRVCGDVQLAGWRVSVKEPL